MHAIFFGMKRAFHGALRITRRPLAAMGLTPARFDMLYALHQFHRYGARQSDLRRKLGVARSTTSRMLVSLEKLGLVHRERMPYDTRQVWVSLTGAGFSRVRHARAVFIEARWAQRTVEWALDRKLWYDKEHCMVLGDEFESFLTRFRTAYRDAATLVYPWHPED